MKKRKSKIVSEATLKMLAICAMILAINSGCKNPNDFGPDGDDLIPPPDPPTQTKPADDTIFYYDGPYPNDIQLEWGYVEGAQFCQIQIGREPSFDGVNPVRVDGYSSVFSVNDNGIYYWRVRAYSTNWEWYTGWSGTWKFSTFYNP